MLKESSIKDKIRFFEAYEKETAVLCKIYPGPRDLANDSLFPQCHRRVSRLFFRFKVYGLLFFSRMSRSQL
jgi:hypothetical protein